MLDFDIQIKKQENEPINMNKNGYIVAENGVFEKINTPLYKAIVQTKNIPVIAKQECLLKLNIPKMPEDILRENVNILHLIEKKFTTEGVIVLFYDFDKKEYINYIPKQKVGAASLSYSEVPPGSKFGKNSIQMGTIHSHLGSAFHSGIDDKDEINFDGIHLTYGNISETEGKIRFEISASAMVGGHRFKINPSDVIEKLEMENGRYFVKKYNKKERANIEKIIDTRVEKRTPKIKNFNFNFGSMTFGNIFNRNDIVEYDWDEERLPLYKLRPRNREQFKSMCEGIILYYVDLLKGFKDPNDENGGCMPLPFLEEDFSDFIADFLDVDDIIDFLVKDYCLLDVWHAIDLERRKSIKQC